MPAARDATTSAPLAHVEHGGGEPASATRARRARPRGRRRRRQPSAYCMNPVTEHVTQLIIFFSSSHSFYVNAPLLRHTTIHHTHHNSTHANTPHTTHTHPQPLPQPRPSTTNRTHPQRPQSSTAPHSPAPHSPADSSRFLLRLNKFQKEYWDCKSVLYNRNMRVRRLVGEAVVKNPGRRRRRRRRTPPRKAAS